MNDPSIQERVAIARREMRSDEQLPEWAPSEWVNAVCAKLGQTAEHAGFFANSIRRVFPGSAVEELEQFKMQMLAVAAVAMDAVEALEREDDRSK